MDKYKIVKQLGDGTFGSTREDDAKVSKYLFFFHHCICSQSELTDPSFCGYSSLSNRTTGQASSHIASLLEKSTFD
ncbi:unnamed protein product [Adineta ricciae]|uniref:Uncharacterized protein n=1 Tax=Adineta ricciae TaxID=249248 RepID=A0A813S1J9_ADIRI|nr:unnamed protein product [Adineta ricciae]